MQTRVLSSALSRSEIDAGPAFPLLDPAEFAGARGALAAFDRFDSYDDFLDEIEGFQIGLAAAGVLAELVPVSIDGFLSWADNFAAPRD